MPVTFTPTVTAGDAPVTLLCTPASGSVFPIGTTPVSCTATDARQRAASCSFNVVVQPPPRLTLTRFVAFGDSITLGEDGNTTLKYALDHFLRLDYPSFILFGREYPTVLQNLLSARYSTQQVVTVNAGRGAEKAGTSDAFARFAGVVGSRAYDVVLLMEGTNDITGGTGGTGAPGVTSAITGLRRMIREAQSRGVRVFLATVPPMNPDGRRGLNGYQTVPLLNAEIRVLANAEGAPLVDVFNAYNGDFSKLSADGLHPNADGFALIARTFYDVIRERLEPATLSGTTGAGMPLLPGSAAGWGQHSRF